MSTIIMNLREAKVTPIHRGSVLWQRAVNRQPRRILYFFDFEIFEISTKNVNFSKPLNPIELFPGIIISSFY